MRLKNSNDCACRFASNRPKSTSKKSSSVLCQAAQVKYAFLKTCLDSKLIGRRKLISVRKAAALLRISTSGYYQWLKVDRYHRHGVHHSDAELLCHVRSVISRCGKQVPGVMRLYLALRQQGLSVGFKRLRRLLRSNGIFHRYHRRYIATTDSNHNLARLPNLIDRRSTAMRSIRLGAETLRISQPTRVGFSWPVFLIWPAVAWLATVLTQP